MIIKQEQYIVKWFLPSGVWTMGIASASYDKALKAIDGYRRFDEKEGKKYKYRIIKRTIQEEVVYNEPSKEAIND